MEDEVTRDRAALECELQPGGGGQTEAQAALPVSAWLGIVAGIRRTLLGGGGRMVFSTRDRLGALKVEGER